MVQHDNCTAPVQINNDTDEPRECTKLARSTINKFDDDEPLMPLDSNDEAVESVGDNPDLVGDVPGLVGVDPGLVGAQPNHQSVQLPFQA